MTRHEWGLSMKTKKNDLEQFLNRLPDGSRACGEARSWARGRTAAMAWETCPRGDWLLWMAGKAGVDRVTIVRAACQCARLSLQFVTPGENRPRIAIETAERWCTGNTSITEVRAAAAAAVYAAGAAAGAAAAAAATATAVYAADAADAAGTAAARVVVACPETKLECANIVREHIGYTTIYKAFLKITGEVQAS